MTHIVATIIPISSPRKYMNIVAPITEIPVLTKLFPTRIEVISLSGLETSLWTSLAFFVPLDIMWRKRILLNEISAVSDIEKKADSKSRIPTQNKSGMKSLSFSIRTIFFF